MTVVAIRTPTAESPLTAAQARRAAIAPRVAAAIDAVAKAEARRSGLVARASLGEEIPARELSAATTALAEAAAHADLLREAAAAADEAVASAYAAETEARSAAWRARFDAALRHHLAAGSALDGAIAATREPLAAHDRTGADLRAVVAEGASAGWMIPRQGGVPTLKLHLTGEYGPSREPARLHAGVEAWTRLSWGLPVSEPGAA